MLFALLTLNGSKHSKLLSLLDLECALNFSFECSVQWFFVLFCSVWFCSVVGANDLVEFELVKKKNSNAKRVNVDGSKATKMMQC